jgi:hypothetical protein
LCCLSFCPNDRRTSNTMANRKRTEWQATQCKKKRTEGQVT